MINITNLSFNYKSNLPIFNNVSFSLRNGIYGLLGENGVGKTTLLHIISGLRFPKNGNCRVLNYESAYRKPAMLSQLYFLPEEFQTPSMSVESYAKYNGVFYSNFSKEQFSFYLSEFQVDREKNMMEMSFGQRKKAMIAFALALNTPIVLLDEPTNGLDIPSKAQFRRILSSLFTEDKCVIISTHQVRDLENLIDPIIILDQNQVLINNTVEEITQKLYFSYTPSKPHEALYTEQILQGYSSVQINENQKESILNIETLFNAAISNKAKMRELFNA